MNDTSTCRQRTGSVWSRHSCGRPVKENGMCAIHLAAKKRVEKNSDERQKKYDRWSRQKAEREQQARDFSAALGVVVCEMWPRDGGRAENWPDRFEMSGDSLRELVKRLTAERAK